MIYYGKTLTGSGTKLTAGQYHLIGRGLGGLILKEMAYEERGFE